MHWSGNVVPTYLHEDTYTFFFQVAMSLYLDPSLKGNARIRSPPNK